MFEKRYGTLCFGHVLVDAVVKILFALIDAKTGIEFWTCQ